MFHLLFQCAHCRVGLRNLQTLPLCQLCDASLVSCPSLCPLCASPRCLSTSPGTEGKYNCLYPWRQNTSIDSYSARYLLIGEGYGVLRQWKKRQGTYFDRRILRPEVRLLDTWNRFQSDVIIPIPQRRARSWKMRGSRAAQIAQWLSRQLQVPVFQPLDVASGLTLAPRQGELGLKGRLENLVRFTQKSPLPAGMRRVILVDDFMTTGKTMKAAAVPLKKNGVEAIHAFCLGIRPAKVDKARQS